MVVVWLWMTIKRRNIRKRAHKLVKKVNKRAKNRILKKCKKGWNSCTKNRKNRVTKVQFVNFLCLPRNYRLSSPLCILPVTKHRQKLSILQERNVDIKRISNSNVCNYKYKLFNVLRNGLVVKEFLNFCVCGKRQEFCYAQQIIPLPGCSSGLLPVSLTYLFKGNLLKVFIIPWT